MKILVDSDAGQLSDNQREYVIIEEDIISARIILVGGISVLKDIEQKLMSSFNV